MGRRIPSFALVLVLAVSPAVATGLVIDAPQVAAQASTVTPNRATVPPPEEYFQSLWQDPMDFNNAEDFNTTPGHMVQQGTASMSGGRLHMQGVQQAFLLRSDPGSAPTTATRDPRSRPLNGWKFRRTTFRMYSDRQSNAAIFFRQCNSCENGIKYFEIKPGWHSYDLDMTGPWDADALITNLPMRGAPWTGWIEMVWMITSFDPASTPVLAMEDFGIIDPSPDVALSVNAPVGSELWMDLDGNQGNDGRSNGAGESASYLGTVARQPTVVGAASGIIPRGATARFYTVTNGVRSAPSNPVTVPANGRPSPRTLSPWEGSGDDWSAVARWDPFDMDQASDASVNNAGAAFRWGALFGWTAGPRPNDPEVVLNLGKPLDGQLFHKVAITINYEGGWGLHGWPGGGMVGRIMWHPYGAGPGSWQVSDDIVVRTGRATYIVEMQTWPPHAILEPGAVRDPIGWGVGRSVWIDGLTFHPHEDPGARNWQIEDVKILRNAVVDPAQGGYDVYFIDDTWAPGTTATIVADPNLDVGDPAQVVLASGLAVGPGVNRFRWSGWPAAPGSYHIRVDLHRNGVSAGSYSGGRVDYGPVAATWPPRVK